MERKRIDQLFEYDPAGTPWWDFIPQSCDCGSPHFPAVDLKVATAEEALWEMEKADPDPYGVGRCPYAKMGKTCPSHPTGQVEPDFREERHAPFTGREEIPQPAKNWAKAHGKVWDGRSTREEREKPSKVSLKRDLIRQLSG